MILGERIEKEVYNFSSVEKQDKREFDDFFPDGRLTEPSDKIYSLRDAIALIKKLGRSLTEEELKQFELK